MDELIEEKWFRRWEEAHIFEADRDPNREKKFVTFPFPYMNGPLHIGHAFTAVRVDVFARYKRMQGYNVLFPWAWHWTGQPIVAAATRLANGDKAMVKEFVEIDGVPTNELRKFYDPKYMAQYYTNNGRLALKKLGLSIDWRREFHTTELEPSFNKFVIWQYDKLRKKGYVTRGTHPVVWCPHDQSPTGDHDRVQGEGVTWEEYTLIMFKMVDGNNDLLPAATFRPETIYGVTNIWINPAANYVRVVVDGKQNWVVSKEAAAKLREQLRQIEIVGEIKGKDLIGKKVYNPVAPFKSILILPATFVDPANGSGVVYSVPAHAPMDFVALRDIQSDSEKQELFALDPKEVKEIHPISLIDVPGMGRFPAVEIVEQMKIRDQNDSNVSAATAEIYKREFHQGVMSDSTGKYDGLKVSQVKPLIVEELKRSNLASIMYDLPDKVICRCLTPCIVKVLQDQWFLKYSDAIWKSQAHQCIDSAEIYPESARQWFHDVIDWIKDWPCARKVGLGTPLSWSPGWIVETLSDSTIYMAFYTIRHLLSKLMISPDSLTIDFFDYVFLGEGDAKSISSQVAVSSEQLEDIRREFLYWYPVNLRNSAKELIPNHLLFFVFQHTAFFPSTLWPKGISANGMMTVEGEKMSKSKGNVITISNALQSFGADTLRAGLVDGAEGMDDIDWREKNARDIQSKISALEGFISTFEQSEKQINDFDLFDYWLENQIQKHIKNVVSNLNEMKTKSAFKEAFYDYWNDLRHYSSATDIRPSSLVKYAVDTWIKMLSPFIPFIAEEINESRGHDSMVCTSSFPDYDTSKLHPEADIGHLLLERIIDDCKNILKLKSQKMKSLHLYIAPLWQYELFSSLTISRDTGTKISEILNEFFVKHPDVNKNDAVNTLNRISKNINELGASFLDNYKTVKDESLIYKNSISYLEKQLGVNVTVHEADEIKTYDPSNKAKYSIPFKPALYFE